MWVREPVCVCVRERVCVCTYACVCALLCVRASERARDGRFMSLDDTFLAYEVLSFPGHCLLSQV
ncbi:hypothetical protein DPMN_029080 [Dreissena polymorpha]|uniref:Uncharacterized protein n=1 Tax=Dreissena polymorpha TaxID=45954 RepID=A0A9D4LY33_DREPO|nr:hypothetical protein DPMN_029080 [Dreissena polymorpha]